MTHTKGPWEAWRHEVRPNDVDIFADARLLASVHMPGDVPDDWRTQEANARLIAKAPEMYELLTLLVRDDLLAIGIAMEISKLLGEIEGKP